MTIPRDEAVEKLLQLGRQSNFSPLLNHEYKPQWVCSECGSSDVQTMDDAWFDPNDNFRFIEAVEGSGSMDWCNNCSDETNLDEAEPPDDPWGNAYDSPMYWIPPEGDEYWEERDKHIAGDTTGSWSFRDESIYWQERLGKDNNDD